MIIANPGYGAVFKCIMQDNRAARLFIQILLNATIEDLQALPDNRADIPMKYKVAAYEFNFIATLKNIYGEYRKMLVQIKKCTPVMEATYFNTYLKERGKILNDKAISNYPEIATMPAVDIYLLSFKLPAIESPAIKITQQYVDLITNYAIYNRTGFIEDPVWETIVLQLPRITGKVNTMLEKLLSLFEQKDFFDDSLILKNYNYSMDDPDIKYIADILCGPDIDYRKRKEIENDIEFFRTIAATYSEEYIQMRQKVYNRIVEEDNLANIKRAKLWAMAIELADLKRKQAIADKNPA